MSKHHLLFYIVLFQGVTFGQRRPNSNQKPPAQKEINSTIKEVQMAIVELCKKNKTQWIMIIWYYYPGNLIAEQKHEDIFNNFNFSCIYNLFFDSEKVKDQFYKPLRP
jgi:hypothetical protein